MFQDSKLVWQPCHKLLHFTSIIVPIHTAIKHNIGKYGESYPDRGPNSAGTQQKKKHFVHGEFLPKLLRFVVNIVWFTRKHFHIWHACISYACDRTLIQSWTLVKSKTRTEGVTEGADHIIICTPFPLLQLGAGGCDSSRGGQGGDSVETNCWPARFGHAHHWRDPFILSTDGHIKHMIKKRTNK